MPTRYRTVTLHVPGVSSLNRVRNAVSIFELLYLSFVWTPGHLDRHGNRIVNEVDRFIITEMAHTKPKSSEWLELLHQSARWERGVELEVRFVEPAGSVNIGLSGVGDAIDAAAEVLDPLRRRERRERVRHESAINAHVERAAHLDNQSKVLEVTKNQIELIATLAAHGAISADEATLAMRNLVSAQDATAEQLTNDVGVSVVSAADDSARELETGED